MSNKIPNFSDEQRDFIKECLVHEDSPLRVTQEFLDMFPEIGNGLDLSMQEIEDLVYGRVQKIKAKYKAELEARKDDDTINEPYEGMPYLSPKWRARYFRKLLRSVKPDDIDRQIKLLRELRAEEKLLNAAREKHQQDVGDKIIVKVSGTEEVIKAFGERVDDPAENLISSGDS